MATTAEKQAEALAIIARIEAEQPMGTGTTRLVSPGCEQGCDPCFRECAIARIQIGALRHLMARNEGFTHEGVTYAGTAGRA